MSAGEPRAKRTPAALLPYQQRWVADKSPVKVCEKSRRTGFSWATAAEATLDAGAQQGQDSWYVGYNREMAEEFIRDVADWAMHFNKVAIAVDEELIDDEEKQILTFVVRFPSGFRVTALSSRPSNLRGKAGRVIIDEAAFHGQLGELLKAALALLMWGGCVSVISTHDGDSNEFNTLVNDIRAGRKPYSLHRVTLDDALNEGLYERICLRTNKAPTPEGQAAWRADIVAFYGDDAEEELFCVPSQSGGAYLARELLEARMYPAPILRMRFKDDFVHQSDEARQHFVQDWCEENMLPLLLQLPKEQRHAFGQDFGRSGDLTVLVPVTILPSLVRQVPFIVELRNCPFKQQEQIVFYLMDLLPRLCGAAFDARGNGQFLAEYAAQRYGSSVVDQVMLSEKWYLDHFPPFRAAIEDAMFQIPRDDEVLTDLRSVQVVRGVPKIAEKRSNSKDGGKRHGDAAIALVLAHAASQMDAGPIQHLSSGRRESLGLRVMSSGRSNLKGFISG